MAAVDLGASEGLGPRKAGPDRGSVSARGCSERGMGEKRPRKKVFVRFGGPACCSSMLYVA